MLRLLQRFDRFAETAPQRWFDWLALIVLWICCAAALFAEFVVR